MLERCELKIHFKELMWSKVLVTEVAGFKGGRPLLFFWREYPNQGHLFPLAPKLHLQGPRPMHGLDGHGHDPFAGFPAVKIIKPVQYLAGGEGSRVGRHKRKKKKGKSERKYGKNAPCHTSPTLFFTKLAKLTGRWRITPLSRSRGRSRWRCGGWSRGGGPARREDQQAQ